MKSFLYLSLFLCFGEVMGRLLRASIAAKAETHRSTHRLSAVAGLILCVAFARYVEGLQGFFREQPDSMLATGMVLAIVSGAHGYGAFGRGT